MKPQAKYRFHAAAVFFYTKKENKKKKKVALFKYYYYISFQDPTFSDASVAST
jgi:hypothetical protein